MTTNIVTDPEDTDLRYTSDEIYDMFLEDKTLNEEFKSCILGRHAGLTQAMYNAVHSRERTMKMVNTHGDFFQEEHNRFVTEYQRFHN